jgi:ribosomal subunit interface protein
MQRNIEFKDFEPDDRTKKLIDRLTAKLNQHMKTFSPELVHLRLFVEHNSARKLYTISITLDLPGKTLAAKEEQHDIQAGLRAAFEEIDRQFKKYKDSLKGEHWKRPERRREVREAKIQAASKTSEQSRRDVFFSIVTPHLDRLRHFVKHVIAYSEAMGDLVEGDLTPEDVIDGALVRAYREFLQRGDLPDVRSSLIRYALDQLDSEVSRLKLERAGTVHVEEDVPETPPEQEVSTLGDEILDFFQPDEDLKVEDLVPDFDMPTPEDNVQRMELQRIVRRTLRQLPREWRRALLSKADDRVAHLAREYFRQKLAEAGYRFKGSEDHAA